MEIPNYKESNITGTKHTRCHHISIYNPYLGTPHVSFHEEEAHVLGEEDILLQPVGQLSQGVDLEDTLTDPETGATITNGELFRWLALAYLTAAAERDQRETE